MVKPIENRLKKTYQQYPSNSKAYAAYKADLSVYIHEISVVVPPSYAPSALKPNCGSVFKSGADCCGKNKDPKRLSAFGAEQNKQNKSANSINRKIRSVIYTAVYKAAIGDKVKGSLPKPAEK